MEAFGDDTAPITHEWPSLEDYNQFPLDKQIKLKRVGCTDRYSLRGFQLEFTNDVKTPLYEAKPGNTIMKYAKINTKRTIRKISMHVNDANKQWMNSLIFKDENDKDIMNI